jgi:DNA-3-methyladenine glycosylase
MEKQSTNSFARSSVLRKEFYERHTVEVARDLLGKVITLSPSRGRKVSARIVEVEAYRGEDDPAAHSSRGWTPRCAPMFESPGIAYVYFIYGMYEMLNFVTEPEGRAGAVLIRAVEPLAGLPADVRTNGPGRLTRALGITREHNRASLVGPEIRVTDDGFKAAPRQIAVSQRIGISKGAELPWRFFIKGNEWVSVT